MLLPRPLLSAATYVSSVLGAPPGFAISLLATEIYETSKCGL